MSARDELAGLFGRIAYPETLEERDGAERAILNMLTPRTITTAEELDALPVGSRVMDQDHETYRCEPWHRFGDDNRNRWHHGDYQYKIAGNMPLPVTVLYEPQP